MQTVLLASVGPWILDVVFFVILLVGVFFGAFRGFVKGICKIAGTLFSIAVAVIFCVAFSARLEAWFGLETALANAIGNATVAGWISIAISFVGLVIIVRLGSWLLGKLGKALVDKFGPLKIVDRCLGGVLGLFEGLLLAFFILAVCYWIPVASMHEYIASSTIVGKVFTWDFFLRAVTLPI